jgi:hypothetical protein
MSRYQNSGLAWASRLWVACLLAAASGCAREYVITASWKPGAGAMGDAALDTAYVCLTGDNLKSLADLKVVDKEKMKNGDSDYYVFGVDASKLMDSDGKLVPQVKQIVESGALAEVPVGPTKPVIVKIRHPNPFNNEARIVYLVRFPGGQVAGSQLVYLLWKPLQWTMEIDPKTRTVAFRDP